MKKLCLVPTTLNAAARFKKIYCGSNFYCNWVLLSPYCLERESCSFFRYSKIAKLVWSDIKVVRLLSLYFGLRFLRRSVREFLRAQRPDFVVVSNDCGLIQGLFVEEANRLQIETVVHQVASASVPSKVSSVNILRRRLKEVFFGFPRNRGYGSNARHAILIGRGWASDLCISNYRVYNHVSKGNSIPAPFGESFQFNPCSIVFLGQPLREINLLSRVEARNHYDAIDRLFFLLQKKGFDVRYKPHPQEVFYRQYDWIIEDRSASDVIDAYNCFVSYSSTMCLDAKLRGKYSLRYDPCNVSVKYRRQSSHYFNCDINFKEDEFILTQVDDYAEEYFPASSDCIETIYENFKSC